MTYHIDSLEGWLVQKEIFTEAIYDGFFDLSKIRTFCDLGCNRGLFTMWLASKIGTSVQGLLVDANPYLVKDVETLLAQNDLNGCIVVHGAVGGGRDGVNVELLIPSTDVGAGLKKVASTNLQKDRCEVRMVPTLNVGRLWEDKFGRITRCDLLKVDIEGAEWQFMLDEGDFLSRVDRLVLEIHEKTGEEAKLLKLVNDNGFHELGRRVAGDGVYLLFAEK